MAQESLLRHIFKRRLVPNKSKKTLHSTDNDDKPLLAVEPTEATGNCIAAYHPNTQDATHASIPDNMEAEQDTTRGISSCQSSCSPGSSDIQKMHIASTPVSLSQQTPAPPTISVRDLLHAAIEEANVAMATHMETLDTTLALLDTIQGMSATVDVLKREMKEKKRMCGEARMELRSFEEAVREMGFVE